mmetsp:Transcript_39327/g.116546  ORF Transcript_39327/g.116546 Transcript_39327/m.116546 type:complete len:245 (-) Transcript_39327:1093-1827(-)
MPSDGGVRAAALKSFSCSAKLRRSCGSDGTGSFIRATASFGSCPRICATKLPSPPASRSAWSSLAGARPSTMAPSSASSALESFWKACERCWRLWPDCTSSLIALRGACSSPSLCSAPARSRETPSAIASAAASPHACRRDAACTLTSAVPWRTSSSARAQRALASSDRACPSSRPISCRKAETVSSTRSEQPLRSLPSDFRSSISNSRLWKAWFLRIALASSAACLRSSSSLIPVAAAAAAAA